MARKTADQVRTALAHEYGSDDPYTIHSLNRKMVMTGGIIRLRENARCAWLMDVIASYRRTEPFQVWELKLNDDGSAVVTMKEDSGCPNLVKQDIPSTDFPLKEGITLWVEDGYCNINGQGTRVNVLMIPSER